MVDGNVQGNIDGDGVMDVKFAMMHWIRWRGNLDELEIKRDCGIKPFGLEYRLMVEAKQIVLEQRKAWCHEELVLAVDTVWKRIHRVYPEQMVAVEVFYRRKESFRAVRMEMGLSQHMTRKLVLQGQDMMRGGLLGFSE